ncbi:MAG TPA: hypothetical protein VL362_02230 [Patescibacteria group bacterium]|jgi:hypothetical protein|nr:hypothetical protein [Patescibacteria group bacterium]
MEPKYEGPIATLADDLLVSNGDMIYAHYDGILAASGNLSSVIDDQFVLENQRLAQFYRDMATAFGQLVSSPETPDETVAETIDIAYRSLLFAYQTCVKFSENPHMHAVGDWHAFAGTLAEHGDDQRSAEYVIHSVHDYLRRRPALEAFLSYYAGILAGGNTDLAPKAEIFAGLSFMLIEAEAAVATHVDDMDDELARFFDEA